MIPDPPAYMQPVAIVDPVLGEDPLIVAARERAARLKANAIIIKAKGAWWLMQKNYSTPAK